MPASLRRRIPLLTAALLLSLPAFATTLATTTLDPAGLRWQPLIAYHDVTLRITGGAGFLYDHDFGAAVPAFALADAGQALADGQYTYELRFATGSATGSSGNGRGSGNGEAGISAATGGAVQSGTFRILGGQLVLPVGPEPARASALTPAPDITQADDVIITGSLCVGYDCLTDGTENFGFATLKFKENNTRILFDDTSSTAGFPATDWQLTANDSASGGANKFSIEDVTAATVPFTISGGAPSNSLFIGSTGRLGIGTATPVLEMHINDRDTPSVRLEQNNAGGFTAQTWDIAGNEANFFIRDVTGGSTLPFRIRPGAASNSIYIGTSGNVGFGTTAPTFPVHIARSDGSAKFQVEETNLANAERALMALKNNGPVRVNLSYQPGASWFVISGPNDLTMRNTATALNQFVLDRATGNLTISGTLTQGSSRTLKENLAPTDGAGLLKAVASLPVYQWSYKANADRHVGPVAEDFHETFKLGGDPTHIAPGDMAGIALASIQALYQQLAEKDKTIASLVKRLNRLEARDKARR